MLKLEEGKYYRDAKGQKIGPVRRYTVAASDPYCWNSPHHRRWWDGNGRADAGPDLVAEWSEPAPTKGPTRTVTRLEVVPGVYGSVHVEKVESGRVYVAMGDTLGPTPHTADELDAAAAVLTELAKAVRDGQ